MEQSKKKHSLKIQNKTIEFVKEDLAARTAQPQPSQTQIPISSKGTGADTKILGHPIPPPPPTHNF